MARMRPVAQRVDDPDIEAGQSRDAFGRQTAEIGRIGHAPKRKPSEAMSPCSCRNGSAVIGPPWPSMVTGSPGARRCSRTIGGYSLPGGVTKQ